MQAEIDGHREGTRVLSLLLSFGLRSGQRENRCRFSLFNTVRLKGTSVKKLNLRMAGKGKKEKYVSHSFRRQMERKEEPLALLGAAPRESLLPTRARLSAPESPT